jgi:hypothetical protein
MCHIDMGHTVTIEHHECNSGCKIWKHSQQQALEFTIKSCNYSRPHSSYEFIGKILHFQYIP